MQRHRAFIALIAAVAIGPAVPTGSALSSEADSDSASVAVKPSISTGTWHTCAVGSDAGVRCWGSNEEKQLGQPTMQSTATPVRVPVEHIIEVAAGDLHTCALDVTGVVWCWGDNDDGQLGDGTRKSRAQPALVRGLSDVIAIAAGGRRSCAVRVDGRAFCWGNGILGALGDGQNHTADVPAPVVGITDAVAITSGDDHACAVHSSGRLSCWGRNTWGQLGDGTKNDSNLPHTVTELRATPSGWVKAELEGAVSAGAGYAHTCVVHADGRVSCWGANWYGQLGNGSTSDTTSPVTVSQVSRAKAISLRNLNSCALLSDGTARCWGSNAFGQIGDGTTSHALLPVAPRLGLGESALLLGNLVAIRTGDHSCAIDDRGVIQCWGANYTGQLGDGTRENRPFPVRVRSLPLRE